MLSPWRAPFTFVNPDRSETTVGVVFATLTHNVLAFQTDDGFSWRLIPTKSSEIAMLKGSAHELLIEEEVTKHK